MDPRLEFFLEDALESVEPTSSDIGRVVLEPDYNVAPEDGDAAALARELRELLTRQSPDPAMLASPEGSEVPIPPNCQVLAKYIRSVTLHQDRVEGPWVEIAPPGNWI
jgi:hypothetical protein